MPFDSWYGMHKVCRGWNVLYYSQCFPYWVMEKCWIKTQKSPTLDYSSPGHCPSGTELQRVIKAMIISSIDDARVITLVTFQFLKSHVTARLSIQAPTWIHRYINIQLSGVISLLDYITNTPNFHWNCSCLINDSRM